MEHDTRREVFRLSADDVMKKVKEVITAGNAKRIIIQNEEGKTLIEIPLTIALVGTLLVPVLAAVGAVAGVLTNCTLVVEHREE